MKSVRKSSRNYALKSMDAARAKLKQAVAYMERNPKLVKSITFFIISSTHSDVELVLNRCRSCPLAQLQAATLSSLSARRMSCARPAASKQVPARR
jgi:hypothetical protein